MGCIVTSPPFFRVPELGTFNVFSGTADSPVGVEPDDPASSSDVSPVATSDVGGEVGYVDSCSWLDFHRDGWRR